MNKFILIRKPRKYAQDNDRPVIRIDNDAYEGLKKSASETGQPVSHIASKAILFALENLEYVEME